MVIANKAILAVAIERNGTKIRTGVQRYAVNPLSGSGAKFAGETDLGFAGSEDFAWSRGRVRLFFAGVVAAGFVVPHIPVTHCAAEQGMTGLERMQIVSEDASR